MIFTNYNIKLKIITCQVELQIHKAKTLEVYHTVQLQLDMEVNTIKKEALVMVILNKMLVVIHLDLQLVQI